MDDEMGAKYLINLLRKWLGDYDDSREYFLTMRVIAATTREVIEVHDEMDKIIQEAERT